MKRILLVIWMGLIIQLSSTSGLQVANPSTWINETVYQENLSFSFLGDIDSEFYNLYQDIFSSSFILHKIAHIVFYSVLVFLFYINFNKSKLFSFIALCLFALSDEMHQYFVVGRSGRALDVALDIAAGAFFLLVLHCKLSKSTLNINKHSQMQKKHKKKRYNTSFFVGIKSPSFTPQS